MCRHETKRGGTVPLLICFCSFLSQLVVTPLLVRPLLVWYSTRTAVMWMELGCNWCGKEREDGWVGGEERRKGRGRREGRERRGWEGGM